MRSIKILVISLFVMSLFMPFHAIEHGPKQTLQLAEGWLQLGQVYLESAAWRWDRVRSQRDYQETLPPDEVAAAPTPATLPATVTSFYTATPSITPSSTQKPIVVTVIHTVIVQATLPAATQRAAPTATRVAGTPTVAATLGSDPDQKEADSQSYLSIAIVGMISTFIAGLVIGSIWTRWTKR